MAETFNVLLPGGTPAMTTRRRRRCCSCRCCFRLCQIFGIIFILSFAVTLIVICYGNPSPITYSVDDVSVKGLNLTLGGGGALNETFHSEFDITISANNTSPKIGISYLSGSSVAVYLSNLLLTNGTMPVFYQPAQNVTVFTVNTTGAALHKFWVTKEIGRKIPLVVDINVPVMLQLAPNFGALRRNAVNCHVLIDGLENANIVSKKCSASLLRW